MKATIKFPNTLRKKVAVAAKVENVKITNQHKVGELTMLEVDTRDPANLFNMGMLVTSVQGDEFQEAETAQAAVTEAPTKKK